MPDLFCKISFPITSIKIPLDRKRRPQHADNTSWGIFIAAIRTAMPTFLRIRPTIKGDPDGRNER